ncbi:uncharacterized protein LOC133730736 [Rosa rugosa]|uniref:uncharacterized protein LOC133730736 n=1 Tax=Rosa rugosa TaxID=74645 RepID=UPI002B41139E|nr:uncharacterized protein LOC133730736 [Rosa rugosa]
MDLKTTFLNGELEEEIFMAQPEGFIEAGKENVICEKNLVDECVYVKVVGNNFIFLILFQSNPRNEHWIAGKKVSRYLQMTKNHMLVYKSVTKLELVGFPDSDFAGNYPTSMKSTCGYVYMLEGATVAWKTMKQSLIATSTMQAEVIAIYKGVCEGLWIKSFILETKVLGDLVNESLKVFCDNEATSMGDSFEYSYVVDVEPNSIQNGFLCKNGLARVRDQVLQNRIFRATTIFSFRCNDGNATFWHNTCLGSVRKNMLSIIGASKRKNDGALIIITEKVTKSMRQWCSRKTLVRKAVNDAVLPSDGLGAAMRGILAGVIQAQSLGGNAKITEDETFFVEGVAKISMITRNCSTHPMLQFVTMIKNLLGNANNIPKELLWFFYLLEQNMSDDEFCRQLPKHPSLYKIEIRLDYRSIAAKKVEFLSGTNRTNLETKFKSVQNSIRLKKVSMRWAASFQHSEVLWKHNIETAYPQNSPFRAALSPPVHLNITAYNNEPLSFLRYGRNLHQHQGNLSYLQIEVELTKTWPDFIPCLHEAFRKCSIRVDVTDEMDNIPP